MKNRTFVSKINIKSANISQVQNSAVSSKLKKLSIINYANERRIQVFPLVTGIFRSILFDKTSDLSLLAQRSLR